MFPKGEPIDLVQKWPFFHLFFKAIQPKKMFFMIFQNEKTPFQAIKTSTSKSRRNDIFPKVLVQKWPFFQLSFLANIGQENVFYDILERKNALLGYKNKKFKKSKKPMVLVQKWPFFHLFFFEAIQARKMSFMIF